MTPTRRRQIKRSAERRSSPTELGARRPFWISLALSMVLTPTVFRDGLYFVLGTLEKVNALEVRTGEQSRSLADVQNRLVALERRSRSRP